MSYSEMIQMRFFILSLLRYLSNNKLSLRSLERSCLKSLAVAHPTGATQQALPEKTTEELLHHFDLKEYFKNPYPFVIRGLIKNSDAVKNWSPESFMERFGELDSPIRLIDENGYNVGPDKRHETGKLKEVIESMIQGKANSKYVDNFADFFAKNLGLEKEIDMERIQTVLGAKLFGSQLFIGGPGTKTIWHCANGFNIFANIYGEKEWQLAHPRYTPFFGGDVHEKAIYAFSHIPHTKKREEYLHEFPYFDRVPTFRALLQPGDVLINPSWWWHCVTNMTPATIGVANRFEGPLWKGNQNKVYAFLQAITPFQWKIYARLNKGERLNDDMSKNHFRDQGRK